MTAARCPAGALCWQALQSPMHTAVYTTCPLQTLLRMLAQCTDQEQRPCTKGQCSTCCMAHPPSYCSWMVVCIAWACCRTARGSSWPAPFARTRAWTWSKAHTQTAALLAIHHCRVITCVWPACMLQPTTSAQPRHIPLSQQSPRTMIQCVALQHLPMLPHPAPSMHDISHKQLRPNLRALSQRQLTSCCYKHKPARPSSKRTAITCARPAPAAPPPPPASAPGVGACTSAG
jgi:hypothetical protein